jgi:hypothetical protein
MNASSARTEYGPQHLKALQRANEVRLARAALKRRVASGDISAADVILACPAEVEGMAVSDLLMSQRRWGRTRCRKFLATIPIMENKQIGTLTERQRRAVAAELPAPIPVTSHAPERAASPAPALAGAV